MANTGSTASIDALTESQKLKQFPINGDSFGVWFFKSKDGKTDWAINDEDGEAIAHAANYERSLKIANGFKASASAQTKITVTQTGLPPDILEHFFNLRAMAMAASAMTIVIEESRSEFRDIDELNAMRRILTCLGNKALEFAEESELFLINSCNTQTTQDGKP